jgi:predicted ATP-grasp superfamily ATP-dependent carboligase
MSVIRALQGRDIPIVAVDPDPRSAGLHSRYVTPIVADFDDLPNLVAIGDEPKPVLFCVDDEDVFASLQREDFRDTFRLPSSGWDVVRPMVDKGEMYWKARKAGFCVPGMEDHYGFPKVLKPTISHDFRQRFGVKAILCETWPQLDMWRERCDQWIIPYVVQEHIPGDETNLYTFAAYSTDGGDVVASFTGRKLHQWPRDFGTARLAESVCAPDVVDMGRALLKHWGYKGISLTEFKRGPDGKLRLIEVNTRPGGWPERLAQVCGANLVLVAYMDAIEDSVPFPHVPVVDCINWQATGYGKRWANVMEDVWLFKRWPGRVTDAFFDWRDPMPFFTRLRGWLRQA